MATIEYMAYQDITRWVKEGGGSEPQTHFAVNCKVCPWYSTWITTIDLAIIVGKRHEGSCK